MDAKLLIFILLQVFFANRKSSFCPLNRGQMKESLLKPMVRVGLSSFLYIRGPYFVSYFE
jgi:hypothetical protein